MIWLCLYQICILPGTQRSCPHHVFVEVITSIRSCDHQIYSFESLHCRSQHLASGRVPIPAWSKQVLDMCWSSGWLPHWYSMRWQLIVMTYWLIFPNISSTAFYDSPGSIRIPGWTSIYTSCIPVQILTRHSRHLPRQLTVASLGFKLWHRRRKLPWWQRLSSLCPPHTAMKSLLKRPSSLGIQIPSSYDPSWSGKPFGKHFSTAFCQFITSSSYLVCGYNL